MSSDVRVEWCLTRSQTVKSTTRPDLRAAQLAGDQNGVVTARQLGDSGIDSDAIRVRVARSQLHPVYHGVYAVGHDALTLMGKFTAAVLVCGDDAVLSHFAAAAFHGLLPWDDRRPEVTVPRNGGRKIEEINVHRCIVDPLDVWRRENIRVTCPAKTILDVAATMPPRALRRMVRQAQAEQKVNVRQLLEILSRHRGRRGAAKLRAVIADGPAPTRSAHEDLVLDLVDRAGVERPETNAKLRIDGRDIIPDMLWRTHKVIVECDSRRWHGDPLTQAFDAEKQAILEAHGYRVLRITWHQAVNHPRQTIARIKAALRQPPALSGSGR